MADARVPLERPRRGIRSMATFVLGVMITSIGVVTLIAELFDLSFAVVGPPVALSAAIVIFTAITAAPRR